MSRPAHIAALDEALEAALLRMDSTDEAVRKVLDRVILEHDRIEKEIHAALTPRANAYGDARNCVDAIKKLGYHVDASRVEGRTYSLPHDLEAARTRAKESK